MQKDFHNKIKAMLAHHIGVEADDIHSSDSLVEDLHMSPADLTDFAEHLAANDFDVTNLDLTQIETVEDLLDKLGEDELI